MSRYRIANTDHYITHSEIEEAISLAMKLFRKKSRGTLFMLDSRELIQIAWVTILGVLKAGFEPTYPRTYMVRCITYRWLDEVSRSVSRCKYETSAVNLRSDMLKDEDHPESGLPEGGARRSEILTKGMGHVAKRGMTQTPNCEDFLLIRELSEATNRVLDKLANNGKSFALGVRIVRAEVHAERSKDVMDELVAETGMQPAALRKSKSRLIQQVRAEVKELLQ